MVSAFFIGASARYCTYYNGGGDAEMGVSRCLAVKVNVIVDLNQGLESNGKAISKQTQHE